MARGYSELIQSAKLVHISYRTQTPVESVHPRVTYHGEMPFVYCNKESIPLADFMSRYARGEPNLRLGAYRANGRQTSVSLTRREHVTLGAPFIHAIEEIRLELNRANGHKAE